MGLRCDSAGRVIAKHAWSPGCHPQKCINTSVLSQYKGKQVSPGGSGVQGHPWLQSKFGANLGGLRLCLQILILFYLSVPLRLCLQVSAYSSPLYCTSYITAMFLYWYWPLQLKALSFSTTIRPWVPRRQDSYSIQSTIHRNLAWHTVDMTTWTQVSTKAYTVDFQ